MKVAVAYHDRSLDFEVPPERLVGVWQGPASAGSGSEVARRVREALEHPEGYPSLRQAVVPGDRVVIALDAQTPSASSVVGVVCALLRQAGVTAETTSLLATGPYPPVPDDAWPSGVTRQVHDPDDRAQMAYLASTAGGRRVYLNRSLVDADVVVAVGRLEFDPVLGYRGPWSVLFPSLSNTETLRDFRSRATRRPPDHERLWPTLGESSDVSWLLGSSFQLGLVPAALGGLFRAIAGNEPSVRAEGSRLLDASWTFRAEQRAETVVVGIGRPEAPTTLDDLAQGLAAATRLVQHGGKIVVLSRAQGTPGPAMQRLSHLDTPAHAPTALRGAEGEADYPAALQLAHALAWADVYLLSDLAEDLVDDLSMIALHRPQDAQRLAAASYSSLFVSHADLTRTEVIESG